MIRRPGDDRGAYLWHMWTQVAIDEQWFDLDATLSPDGPGFHPGHLAITTGDLSPASLNSSGTRMLEVFGAIDIEGVFIKKELVFGVRGMGPSRDEVGCFGCPFEEQGWNGLHIGKAGPSEWVHLVRIMT